MLKKSRKIPSPAFTSLRRKKGVVLRGDGVTAVVFPGIRDGDGFRCAVVVSKKTAQKATRRNRIKRRVFSVIREVAGKNPPPGAWVFYMQKTALSTSYTQLRDAIRKIMHEYRAKNSDWGD